MLIGGVLTAANAGWADADSILLQGGERPNLRGRLTTC
jgi:hypothetical protein